MATQRIPMAPLVAVLVLFMAAQQAFASRELLGSACSPMWGQCGGLYWNGPKCCKEGSVCKVQVNNGVPNAYYSQCLPDTPTPKCVPLYQQCGGIGYTGPTCCTKGSSCQVMDAYYSQCRPDA